MKKTVLIIIPTLLLVLLLSSCEKIFLEDDPDDSPRGNFEFLWQEIDDKYTYLDLKEIDWNIIHDKYQAKISEDMDEAELFEVLASMLSELKDGHVNLLSSFDRSRNWSWFLDFAPNFNETLMTRNYLGDDYMITGGLKNQLIDSVLYVYYSSFGSRISNEHLDFLMLRAQGMKGIVFDVRSNGGGSLGNAEALASSFSEEEYAYARSRMKIGSGKDDYSPWDTLTISPRDGEKYTGQIVLLCNRSSYSASSFFAQMMKSLPNAILMGDNTGGGGGVPAYGELPNGWIYRFSSTQTTSPEGVHIEGGVEVDILIDMDLEAEIKGVDTIIEAALEFLN